MRAVHRGHDDDDLVAGGGNYWKWEQSSLASHVVPFFLVTIFEFN
jgi:hypothetical protein